MNKFLKTLLITFTIAGTFCMTCHAADFSSYWYANADGSWFIQDGSGNTITNAWVCDNAVTYNNNTDTHWYLMDSTGKMYEGIIQDQNGDYYLLNPNHDGGYGMLVTTNGFSYNGQSFYFEQNHSGAFGKVLNPEVIAQSGIAVTQVNTEGKPIYYTANFGNMGGSSSNSYGGNTYNAASSTLSASNAGAGNIISVGNSTSAGQVQQQSSGIANNDLFTNACGVKIDIKPLDMSHFSDEFLNGTVRFGG